MKAVLDSAKNSDPTAEIIEYNINRLSCKGCQGCLACKKPDIQTCVQQDDLSPVLEQMIEADVWVLGTPVYMGHTSAQLCKISAGQNVLFHRPNCWSVRIPEGKKCLFVITQGCRRPPPGHNGLVFTIYVVERRLYKVHQGRRAYSVSRIYP